MGTGEQTLKTQPSRLGFAEGLVDPQARIDTGEIRLDRLDELVRRLETDEFIIKGDEYALPCQCMDCRPQTNGDQVLGPKAAGGTFTITMADVLTTQSYRRQNEKAPVHHQRVAEELKQAGHEIGGHEADSVLDANDSGCGAQDKADSGNPDRPSILGFMDRKSTDIFGFINSLGINTSAKTEAEIKRRIAECIKEGYITSGAEISQATKKVGGNDSVTQLTGPQKGVVAAIVTRAGEYYDATAITKEFGPDYQVFEVSAWAIINGAKETSLTPEEAEAKTIAGLAFNVGAAGVIAGPGMRLAVR